MCIVLVVIFQFSLMICGVTGREMANRKMAYMISMTVAVFSFAILEPRYVDASAVVVLCMEERVLITQVDYTSASIILNI